QRERRTVVSGSTSRSRPAVPTSTERRKTAVDTSRRKSESDRDTRGRDSQRAPAQSPATSPTPGERDDAGADPKRVNGPNGEAPAGVGVRASRAGPHSSVGRADRAALS